jgi:signal transduction histidine kinase
VKKLNYKNMGKDKKKKNKSMKFGTRILISFLAISTIPILMIIFINTMIEFFRMTPYGVKFSEISHMFPELYKWAVEFCVIAIAVLVITSFCINMWIYFGVSGPIGKLRKATKSIRDGNLDFSVDSNQGIQEMNDLFEDFEEMRKRLKESQEEKLNFDSENKELIRNISHDLKTPITAVKGYCEGIMDGVADTPEKMNKYIRTIYNKTNEMDRLINELTYYSKIDTNRMPYTFTKIDVNDYFNDCADELELELERENVRFNYTNELKDNALIIADAEQLRRAIHNIVNNSVKYMDKPERKIELRLKDAGDFVQIEIEDNGKGIAKKDQSRIFDRFYRTDASRNSTRGGSGIGLSIVRKILEDHGGKVWAGGEEGVGTIISFVLRKYQEVTYDE